jgi:hypothetical protein
MIATNFSELDTLFKDIQRLHEALTSSSASSLDHDLLVDKVKIYYSLLKNLAPTTSPINPIEKTTPESETKTYIAANDDLIASLKEDIHMPVNPLEEPIAPASEIIQTIMPPPIAPIFDLTPPQTTEIPATEENIPPIQEMRVFKHPNNDEKENPQIQTSVRPHGYGQDSLTSKQEKPTKKDLKTIIDINTRFGLIQHFFKGNIDFYNHELGWIGEASDLEEAEKRFSALCLKYNQLSEAELSASLWEIIKRCYK